MAIENVREMIMTTTVDTATCALYDALRKFQEACPPILKNREGDAKAYKYRYADYAKVIETIKKPLADAGLSFSQPIRTVDGKCKLLTYVFHVGGGMIESDIDLALEKLQPQEVGKLLSYYRRYSLTTTLGLAADEDDDAAGAQNDGATPHQQQAANKPRMPEDVMKDYLDSLKEAATSKDVAYVTQHAIAEAAKYNDADAHDIIRKKGADRWNALAAKELEARKGRVVKDPVLVPREEVGE